MILLIKYVVLINHNITKQKPFARKDFLRHLRKNCFLFPLKAFLECLPSDIYSVSKIELFNKKLAFATVCGILKNVYSFTFHFIDLTPQKRVGVNVDGTHVLLILMKGGHEAAKVFI